jgi:hypothetical protein
MVFIDVQPIDTGSPSTRSGVMLSDSVLYPSAFNNVKDLGLVVITAIRNIKSAA